MNCTKTEMAGIPNLTAANMAYRLKDFPPYMFKLAIRCLSGIYPLECFPEELNEYKEELQELLNSQRENLNW